MLNELGDEHHIWKLKSVSLFAFIIWSLIVYVQSTITPFWMQYITTKWPSFKVAWLLPLGMMILVTTMASNLSSTRSLPTWKFLACSPWFLTHWLKYCTLLNSSTALVSPLRTCTPLCLRPATSFHVCLVISISTPLTLDLRTPLLNLRLA